VKTETKRKVKKNGSSQPNDSVIEGKNSEEAAEIEILPAESEISDDILSASHSPLEDTTTSEEEDTSAEESSKDLVRYDALAAYLREVSRIPLLSREEEHTLAERYHQNKDLKAAYKLVSSNLWLVVKIAREYERAARSILDLIQEGNIGLMEAVKNFDPYRNVRFPSYAIWWVKAYIVRYLISNWRMVKIGTTQAQRKLFFNLHKEKERLEREGFKVEPKLIADRLNVKESDVIEMEQRLSQQDLSVDLPTGEDESTSLISLLPSEQANAEELLSSKQTRQNIADLVNEYSGTLNEKEQLILQERLLNEEKATLQEVSAKLGISKERVRQLENRIRDRLRNFALERLGVE